MYLSPLALSDMWRIKVAFAFFPSTYFHYAFTMLMAYYEGQMTTNNNVRLLVW